MKIVFTCPEYGCDQSISVEAHLDMVSTRKGERWEGMAECSMCGKEYRFRIFTEQVTCGADAIADMADAAIADMKRYKPTIGVGVKPGT